MARGMSKAAKAADYDRIAGQLSRTEIAMHDLLNSKAQWGRTFRHDGCAYTCAVVRGGDVITRFACKRTGQSDSYRVENWEKLRNWLEQSPWSDETIALLYALEDAMRVWRDREKAA